MITSISALNGLPFLYDRRGGIQRLPDGSTFKQFFIFRVVTGSRHAISDAKVRLSLFDLLRVKAFLYIWVFSSKSHAPRNQD